MNLTSDQWIFWQHGFFKLNETIVTTWGMMFFMALGAMLVTRRLSTDGKISRWQSALEIIVTTLEQQIKEVGLPDARKYLAFLGTLFLFVALCALCTVIPGYTPPTGSLSTTAALALSVFIAIPLYGIKEQGFGGYSQFEELETFAKFGTHLDDATRKTIDHGQRIRACLKQAQSQPVPVVDQIAVLLALEAGLFDQVPLEKVAEGEAALQKALAGLPNDVAERLASDSNDKLSDDDRKSIVDLACAALAALQPKPAQDAAAKATP